MELAELHVFEPEIFEPVVFGVGKAVTATVSFKGVVLLDENGNALLDNNNNLILTNYEN